MATLAGFVARFALDPFLPWHHRHRTEHDRHRPHSHLISLAGGLHDLIGGLAVAGAFIVDIRVGVVTWLVAAAHQTPQELGDVEVLVHSGSRRQSALAWSVASALTLLVGGLVAYPISGTPDVPLLLPFAAGNSVYIAAADLIPELAATDLR